MGTKICVANQKMRDKKKGLKDGSLLSMFGQMARNPAPRPVPSTTCAPEPLPAPVHPRPQAITTADEATDRLTLHERSPEIVGLQHHPVSQKNNEHSPVNAPVSSLVNQLKALAQRLCVEVSIRSVCDMKEDPLACFDVDPVAFDNQSISADDLWEEVINGMMKNGLGWGTELDVPSLLNTNGSGLMGLVRFVEYFVVKRKVDEGLFEGKLTHLMSGLRLL